MAISGFIGLYGLESWWLDGLSSIERCEITEGFSPFGGGDSSSLVSGNIQTNQRAADFLVGLAGWFKKSNPVLAEKIVHRAVEALSVSTNTREKHFACIGLIKYFYSRRNETPEFYQKAIELCLIQISVSKKAIKQIGPVSHTGFKQLAIIYDKEKRYTEAITICQQALADGWEGDWAERIAKLQKKIQKAG